MRRALPFVLLAAILLALGVGAVVSAGDEGDDQAAAKPVASSQPVANRAAGGHGGPRARRMLRTVADQVVTSGAQRLGVEKRVLRKAVRATAESAFRRHFKAAGVTRAERANLRACHRSHGRRSARRGAGCDRAEARATLRRLHAAGLPDLAKEKALLSAELAERLGKTPAEVLTAARAELELRLGQAAGLGLVTAKGRELALGCFDIPSSCDVRALHREVKLPFRHP